METKETESTHGEWMNRHLWQIQPVRDILLVAVVLLILYLGRVVSLVTVPLLLALLLAYLFEPILSILTRRKWISRSFAAIIVIALAGVLILVPIGVVGSFAAGQGFSFLKWSARHTTTLVEFTREFDRSVEPDAPFVDRLAAQPDSARDLHERLPNDAWRQLGEFYITQVDPNSEVTKTVEDWFATHAQQIARHSVGTGTDALQALIRAAMSVGALAFMLFLTAFFFYFICTGYPKVVRFGEKLIPDRNRERVLDLISQMDRAIAGFIRGRLTICLIQCIFFSIGFWIAGVPAPILLGAVVGVLAIVPYLSLVGVPIAILMILLDPPSGFRGEWWWMVFAPVGVYMIGQSLDEYVLSPVIQGKATNMDTPTILFASIAGGILGGFYGLLIAIPVAACVKILLRELVWPRFTDWVEGRSSDPLPIGERDPA